jgi:hypothetical protein
LPSKLVIYVTSNDPAEQETIKSRIFNYLEQYQVKEANIQFFFYPGRNKLDKSIIDDATAILAIGIYPGNSLREDLKNTNKLFILGKNKEENLLIIQRCMEFLKEWREPEELQIPQTKVLSLISNHSNLNGDILTTLFNTKGEEIKVIISSTKPQTSILWIPISEIYHISKVMEILGVSEVKFVSK